MRNLSVLQMRDALLSPGGTSDALSSGSYRLSGTESTKQRARRRGRPPNTPARQQRALARCVGQRKGHGGERRQGCACKPTTAVEKTEGGALILLAAPTPVALINAAQNVRTVVIPQKAYTANNPE